MSKCNHIGDCFTCPYDDCIANDPREIRNRKVKVSRYDFIKNVNLEQMANFLCDMIDNNSPSGCATCPASEFCYTGHKGFIDWLKQEIRTDGRC